MFKKADVSSNLNASYASNFTVSTGTGKNSPTKKPANFTNESNPFVHHKRTNLNASMPDSIAAKPPFAAPVTKKNPPEEDTISRATSQKTFQPAQSNYARSYSNHSLISGVTVRTERSGKIFNTDLLKPKPKPPPPKFCGDSNPFVNSSRTQLNSAGSKASLNEIKKLDVTKQSQEPVMEKINNWQQRNKAESSLDNASINKINPLSIPSYSKIDAPFVVSKEPLGLNMSRSTMVSPAPRDASKGDISFMMAGPENFQNRFSTYFRNKITRLNIVIFLFFLVVLCLHLVALVSPYWLVMKEPWIERYLIPKQFILDPDKTNAWIGIYSSCNTENHCTSGTPYDDRGWYNICKVLYALSFTLMCMAFVVECVYVCCMAYVLVPTFKLVLISSLLILIGAICSAVTVATYGASCLSDGLLTPMSLNGPGGDLTWGYSLAIVSTALSFLAALLFGIDAVIQSRNVPSDDDGEA